MTTTIPYSPIDGELWKPIPGYDGRYEASSEGRIRRVKGKRSGERLPRILRTFIADGYVRTVLMRDDGSQYKPGVHVLVAEAFLGPCPSGQEVNHMDLDKFNNRACNLEYLTRLDNQRHARSLKSWSASGEGSGQAKLTEDQVRAIRLDSRSQRVVGQDYGVSGVAVCLIRQRKNWKHVED